MLVLGDSLLMLAFRQLTLPSTGRHHKVVVTSLVLMLSFVLTSTSRHHEVVVPSLVLMLSFCVDKHK